MIAMKQNRRPLLFLPVLLVGLWACPAAAHDKSAALIMMELGDEANQGDVEAHYLMAYELAVGDRSERDDEKALALFHDAAALGNPGAQIVLSHYYAVGFGVKADKAEAYKWALLAALHGSPVAKQFMPDFEKTLTPEQHAEGQRLAKAWKVMTFEQHEAQHGLEHHFGQPKPGEGHLHPPDDGVPDLKDPKYQDKPLSEDEYTHGEGEAAPDHGHTHDAGETAPSHGHAHDAGEVAPGDGHAHDAGETAPEHGHTDHQH